MGVEFVNEHHVTSLTLLFFFLEAKIFFLVCGFAQKEHYQKFDPDFLSKFKDLKSYVTGKCQSAQKNLIKFFSKIFLYCHLQFHIVLETQKMNENFVKFLWQIDIVP